MKGTDLFKGMGYIDDDLAGEALDAEGLHEGIAGRERRRMRTRGWTKWGVLAACLALAVGWGAWRGGYLGSAQKMEAASEPMLSMQSAKSSDDGLMMDAAPMESAPEAAEEFDVSANGTYYAGTESIVTTEKAETPMAAEAEPAQTANAEEDAPATDTGDEPAAAAYLPDMPYGESVPEYAVRKMITGMPAEEDSGCYVMPRNGEVFLSVPLNKALETYGDEVLYRVVVEIFKDAGADSNGDADEEDPVLDPDSDEAQELMERLSRGFGYVTAIETFTDADGSVTTWNTLHAEYGQLTGFPADEDHGYMLWLYDEIVR